MRRTSHSTTRSEPHKLTYGVTVARLNLAQLVLVPCPSGRRGIQVGQRLESRQILVCCARLLSEFSEMEWGFNSLALRNGGSPVGRGSGLENRWA
jgi:hypothetical protein